VGMVAGEIRGLTTGDLNRDDRSDLVTVAGTEIQLWRNPGAAVSETRATGTALTVPVGVQQNVMTVTDLDRMELCP